MSKISTTAELEKEQAELRLEPGATVRYSGGTKAGRVDKLKIDPHDPGRIEVTFSVQSDLPVKTDSKAKIMSLSPLGENHLEIVPGSAQAGLAKDGSLLPSEDYLDFNSLTKRINDIAPDAQQLLRTLNDRAVELKVTVDRVNDLLNGQNRANLAATLVLAADQASELGEEEQHGAHPTFGRLVGLLLPLLRRDRFFLGLLFRLSQLPIPFAHSLASSSRSSRSRCR